MKVYLAVSIIDGKAEVSQIAERYFNDYGWRLRMQYRTDKNGQELSMLGFGSRPVRPRADLAGPVQARA